MADGIDRKADERMEFTTSKDVTVAPTFTEWVFPSFSSDVF
jgi:ATP-dependent RNA helicase